VSTITWHETVQLHLAHHILSGGGDRVTAVAVSVYWDWSVPGVRCWLSAVEADLSRGTWLDEDLGRQSFGNYTRAWLRDHPRMGPRCRETCARNFRLHLVPLDDVPLRALTPQLVREWYAAALRGSGWANLDPAVLPAAASRPEHGGPGWRDRSARARRTYDRIMEARP
jgi:hypothetical protein